ncbi:glycosyltransferase family 4 protein [Natrialbaceae archaeon A-CW1-1]
MRIAFVHPGSPSAEGTGAVHSATLIGESLIERGHDVVFYCTEEVDQSYSSTKTVELDMPKITVKNKYGKINKAILRSRDDFGEFDIVHSYLMRTIPSITKLGSTYDSLTTVVTLNAYGGVCPKNDLMFENRIDCQEQSSVRCGKCILKSKSELPQKPNRGNVYRKGRVFHHSMKDFRNISIVNSCRKLSNNIDAYQALSAHVKSKYSTFGFDSERIEVIPNILDERFCQTAHQQEDGPTRLLYVGGIKSHKGADRLPRIFKDLKDCDEDYELTIVGEGELKYDIRENIKSNSLSNEIDLMGFVNHSDLPGIYHKHDIFVYPGRWDEPFGRVFLESLASGTPIVSSDVGSVSEIIGDGGVTVQGSTQSFVKAIEYVREEQSRFSENAVIESRRFTREKVIQEIEKLYKKAIESTENMST